MKVSSTLSTALVASLIIAAPALHAQHPPASAQQWWLSMAVGGGTLGPAAVSSLWYTHGLVATSARWSETAITGLGPAAGTGDEHELSGLIGVRLPVWRGMVLATGGVGRAAGCFARDENERCRSLGVEAAPAWGVDLVLPLSSHFGVHVVGFGVRGRRVRYSGVSAGFDLGRFR
jgi:hypothetical protein